MAMAMREAAGKLIAAWRRHGCDLGFGTGIAQGYATLGQIGFSERSGYTAIGTVCNLAARLCAEAKDGQILISSRIAEAVEAVAIMEDLGNLELRGLRRPVAAFNVVQSASEADARSNLTVVRWVDDLALRVGDVTAPLFWPGCPCAGVSRQHLARPRGVARLALGPRHPR
jgi:class 3 adenylate cyclase